MFHRHVVPNNMMVFVSPPPDEPLEGSFAGLFRQCDRYRNDDATRNADHHRTISTIDNKNNTNIPEPSANSPPLPPSSSPSSLLVINLDALVDDEEDPEDVVRPEDLAEIDGINDLSAVVSSDGIDLCRGWHVSSSVLSALLFLVFTLLGLALGLWFERCERDRTSDVRCLARIGAAIMGWWSTFCWWISFPPQLIENYKRGSIIGQSLSFIALNVLGFGCYCCYTLSFYYDEQTQREYNERFRGSKNDVQRNDVWFALLAFGCTIINLHQAIFYSRGAQIISPFVTAGIGVAITFLAVSGFLIFALGVRDDVFFNRLSLLYAMGVVKIIVTLVKYPAQLILNARRKTTVGANIHNFSLDLAGGVMSVCQQLLLAHLDDNWRALAGNWVKLSLGAICIIYDCVFMLQHFCLFERNNRRILAAACERRRRLQHLQLDRETASE